MIKFNLQLFGGRGSGGGKGGSGGFVYKGTDPVIQAMEADSAEERAYALKDALKANGKEEGDGWYVRDNIVSKAEALGGEYETEVQIDTSKKGYLKMTFVHSDGTSYKDTHDSASEAIRAATRFFRGEREWHTLWE